MDERILKTKLVPVVVFKQVTEIKPTLDALKAGGIKLPKTLTFEETLNEIIKYFKK